MHSECLSKSTCNTARVHALPAPEALRCVQLKGLPFIAFDQGGVMEMIDSRDIGRSIILEPSAEALQARLMGTLTFPRSAAPCM